VKKDRGSGAKDEKSIITIMDGKNGLPYSKGLMASSIMATGLTPSQSYRVAQMVQDQLRAGEALYVTTKQLIDMTAEVLRAEMGEEYAEKYLKWQALSQIDKPLVLLIGGATGVGKSTIATEVAHRLGIRRIVQTDAIREVMRAVFSKELMPTLHYSSFEAWRGLRAPLTSERDRVIIGFEDQISAVAVGLQAVIERAVRESLDIVIEGVHVVPGFIETQNFANAFVFPIIIKVDEPQLHKSHFYVRDPGLESHRPFKRYLENFDNIRRIGSHIEDLAKSEKFPVITCYSLDATITSIIEVIYNEVFDKAKRLVSQGAKEELYEDIY